MYKSGTYKPMPKIIPALANINNSSHLYQFCLMKNDIIMLRDHNLMLHKKTIMSSWSSLVITCSSLCMTCLQDVRTTSLLVNSQNLLVILEVWMFTISLLWFWYYLDITLNIFAISQIFLTCYIFLENGISLF